MPKTYEELEAVQAELLNAVTSNDTSEIASLIKEQEAQIDSAILKAAAESENVDTLFDTFTKNGWNPNQYLGHEGTPLIAVMEYPEAVRSLLDHNADPNFGNVGSSKPLDVAVHWTEPDTVKLLIDRGAQVRNRNALKEAAYWGRLDMIELLLENGADVNEIPDYEDMLDGERRVGLGTALHEAARNGQEEAVKLLVEKGAKKDIKNTLGKTPAQLAKEKRHPKIAELLRIQ